MCLPSYELRLFDLLLGRSGFLGGEDFEGVVVAVESGRLFFSMQWMTRGDDEVEIVDSTRMPFSGSIM